MYEIFDEQISMTFDNILVIFFDTFEFIYLFFVSVP